MLYFGWQFFNMPRNPEAFDILDLHVGIGVVAMPFFLARIVWRIKNGKPKASKKQSPVLEFVAGATWRLLLAGIIIQEITGPLMVWTHAHHIPVLGLFEIPSPLPFMEKVHAVLKAIHIASALMIAMLIVLHVSGALKHFIIDRDEILPRMIWPGAGRLKSGDNKESAG